MWLASAHKWCEQRSGATNARTVALAHMLFVLEHDAVLSEPVLASELALWSQHLLRTSSTEYKPQGRRRARVGNMRGSVLVVLLLMLMLRVCVIHYIYTRLQNV